MTSASVEIVRPGLRHGSVPERQDRRVDAIGALPRMPDWWRPDGPEALSFDRFAPVREAVRREGDALDAVTSAVVAAWAAWRDGLRTALPDRQLDEARKIRAMALLERLARETLGMALHDEQLFAIWCLLHGKLVEMPTGEGKTVTAGLAAAILAATGMPVHVITVNEYLVERDAALLRPLYDVLGLDVGCVFERQSDDERRAAYAAAITYVGNRQVVFDYLRDRRALAPHRNPVSERLHALLDESRVEPVMRGLCCAIVDEADSVLVDDAGTPCVLATAEEHGPGDVTEAATALGAARALERDIDFVVGDDAAPVRLTEAGLASLHELGQKLGGLWRTERYRQERVCQALKALHHFRADHHYLVRDGKVVLIDTASGRLVPDRRLQHGLHRMLELKERVQPTSDNATVAAISVQAFFLRYHTVLGMSGTLTDVGRELRQVYGLATVTVPPHLPSRRSVLPTRVLPTRERQMEVLVELVRERQRRGQPVLVGTRSVAFSRRVSEALSRGAIDHDVLSASQDAEEARVIARAGERGAVTVATNMAGRGTDIPLRDGARARGGLMVINLELNDSIRVDRQLFGRAARQGDPGDVRYLLSWEDELLRSRLPAALLRSLARRVNEDGVPRSPGLVDLVLRFAQGSVERRQRLGRLRLHRNRGNLERQLAVGGDGA